MHVGLCGFGLVCLCLSVEVSCVFFFFFFFCFGLISSSFYFVHFLERMGSNCKDSRMVKLARQGGVCSFSFFFFFFFWLFCVII